MPPTDDNTNHRVTNARLSEQINSLTGEVRRLRETVDKRFSFLEEKLEVEVSDLRGRCQDNATQIARLDERQKATTGLQAGLTFLLSSVAATIGALFK